MPESKTTMNGLVLVWLRPNTFQVQTTQGVLTATDRTGKAQPGRTVTLIKVGGIWVVA